MVIGMRALIANAVQIPYGSVSQSKNQCLLKPC